MMFKVVGAILAACVPVSLLAYVASIGDWGQFVWGLAWLAVLAGFLYWVCRRESAE